MSLTLITHLSEESYRALDGILKPLGTERVCRVPYGRVKDSERYAVDTLPYHFTVTSTKEPLSSLAPRMQDFEFVPFSVEVNGLDVMRGRNNSRVLYLKISPSSDFYELQDRLFSIFGNEKYLPGENVVHMTLCISKDWKKVFRIKHAIESTFSPFELQVTGLGLYEIWPGRLIAEFGGDNGKQK